MYDFAEGFVDGKRLAFEVGFIAGKLGLTEGDLRLLNDLHIFFKVNLEEVYTDIYEEMNSCIKDKHSLYVYLYKASLGYIRQVIQDSDSLDKKTKQEVLPLLEEEDFIKVMESEVKFEFGELFDWLDNPEEMCLRYLGHKKGK